MLPLRSRDCGEDRLRHIEFRRRVQISSAGGIKSISPKRSLPRAGATAQPLSTGRRPPVGDGVGVRVRVLRKVGVDVTVGVPPVTVTVAVTVLVRVG
jgi:hypothetical protein